MENAINPDSPALLFLNDSCPKILPKMFWDQLVQLFGENWFSELGFNEAEVARSIWDPKADYSDESKMRIEHTIRSRMAFASRSCEVALQKEKAKKDAEKLEAESRKHRNWLFRQQKKKAKEEKQKQASADRKKQRKKELDQRNRSKAEEDKLRNGFHLGQESYLDEKRREEQAVIDAMYAELFPVMSRRKYKTAN